MDGQNYLVFHNDSNDSYMNSSANFRGADVGTTFIDMYFVSATIGTSASGYDKVRLTVTATKEEQALEDVGAALAGTKNPVMVVADDVNGNYISDHVTAVASITLASKGTLRNTSTTTPSGDGSTGSPTVTLTAANSGTTYFADISTYSVAYKLPAVSGNAGVHYKFILDVASDAEGTKDLIVTTAAAGDDIIGVCLDAGAVHDTATGNSTLTLDTSAGAAGGGDRFGVICDGTDWYIEDGTALTAAIFVSS